MPNRSNNNSIRERKKQKLDNSTTNSNKTNLRTRNTNNSSDHYITTDEELELEEEVESDTGELENIVKPVRNSSNNNSKNRLRNNATSSRRTKFQSNNSNRINNNLKRRNSLPRKQSPTQSTSNSINTNKKRDQSNNNNNSNTLNTRRSSFTKVLSPLQPSRQNQLIVSSPSRPLRKSLHVQFSDNNLMAPLNVGGKRLREPSGGTPIARKSTRSATMTVLPDHDRGKKRKREIIALQDEELLESDEEEVEEEDIEDYEEEEEETEELEEGRRLRSADTKVDDEEEEDEELGEEPEQEEEVEEEEFEENDDNDVETEGDHFNLFTANTTQLKRLKRAELVRLYALATSEPLSEVDALHKPSLVEGIIANRPITTDEEPSGSEEEEEEAVNEEEEEEAVASGDEEELEEGDDVDSPRPGTSHETSPVTSTSTRRRGNTASARAGRKGKTVGSISKNGSIKRKSKLRNLVDLNQDVPEDEEEEEDEEVEEEEEEEELGENDTVRDHASSSSDEVTKPSIRFNKRGSQSLPGLTSIPPPRRQLRNRSTGSADSNSSLIFGMEASPVPTGMRRLRNGKKVGTILGGGKGVQFHHLGALGEASGSGDSEEEEEDQEVDTEENEEEMDGMSPPVATRTRHGAPSAAPKSMTSSPKARPGRIAKSKAVANIVRTTSSRKGKEKAIDQDTIEEDDEEEEMEVDGDEEEEQEEVTTTRNRNGSKIATTRSGLRRGSHNSQPSDADDEEEEPDEELDPDDEQDQDDDDDDGEGDMSVEMVSHQRAAAATHLRNGKVVVLVPDEELEEEEGSENGMEVEEEEEEEEEEDGEEEDMADEDEGDLANATSKSLLRRRRDDLVRLCEERSIAGEGTKKELVHALLEWRNHEASSGESSSHSTLSAGSNATARGETKTQALRAIPSITTVNGRTPLLMRPGHSYSASPEKPHTLPQSKADEQEEVNALDLESLQLQDKEIAPDKLTRLEQVGSGGFKDVFKGLYRKKSVAISDIRGHLTEMDIKELGLLRDLRHPNIVHFIGVSIPKEPSSVPVMIVTELCANGDLFDYIRAVPCPAFSVMLDIMLGISKGVDYLHTRKPTIIHRDIKASNVLITAAGTAKINDFGLARVKTNARSMIRSLVGTVNYQAPELWTPNPRYNEKVDVYSVALVFWEVCQWNQAKKRYPFEGMNEHAIYSEAGQKKIRPSLIAARRVYGQGIADLIEAMWQADFKDRPSMSQVVLELQVLLTAEKEKKN